MYMMYTENAAQIGQFDSDLWSFLFFGSLSGEIRTTFFKNFTTISHTEGLTRVII